jgi:hydrogenase maturation protein HypF
VLRLAVHVQGIVQGVGFRPFVYDAALKRGLSGWVQNRTDGLCMEIEGPEDVVREFLTALRRDRPASARIERIDTRQVALVRDEGFSIVASTIGGAVTPTLPADQATCAECLAEVASPGARRHRYPFTNCTRCGPRYTIIEALPYDRRRTSMRRFTPCSACAAEYDDPADRRFHAQPIACPACGPTLRLLAASADVLAHGDAALEEAALTVRSGRILALQGLGGFQLLVDATDDRAVTLLRQRKGRGEKPLAVMFASLAAVRAVCVLPPLAAEALESPEAPIVLLRRLAPHGGGAPTVTDAVAPRNPWLGVLLPYTPLHRLLLDAAGRPLVCTSGNRSEEPMCVETRDACARLGGIADRFLVHDRPIVRPVDDSIVRIGPSGPQVLRRARGFAPLPLAWPVPAPGSTSPSRCVLAFGAHLKSTVALARNGQVIVSQHLGDLASLAGVQLLERTVADLLRFFAARPEVLACDLHPDYASTRLAERLAMEWGLPLERVQHHHAHVAACMAEYGLTGPVLGLAWDGAGLGSDGTLWGGEALAVDGAGFARVATLRRFGLPGGEQAMREPRRAALGVLYEIFGAECVAALGEPVPAAAAQVLVTMLERRLQTSATTSMGRLFDAVAALTGIRRAAGFEGQAAMEVEFAAERAGEDDAYPFPLRPGDPAVADWEPLIRALLDDRAVGIPAERMAARFHQALAALAEAIACHAGRERVVLSGGCFQNLHLLSAVHARLAARGFAVYVPHRYPPNDGSIALGQTWVATRRDEERSHVSRHTG